MSYLSIAKVPLSLMISLSALFGFALQKGSLGTGSFSCFWVVFLLSTGCASLNNIQDVTFDGRLNRTKIRPLPTGKIMKSMAAIQAVLLLASSLLSLKILGGDSSTLPFYGGLAAIVLYNGIYTPLKPNMILAIIPGAICGMMAPLIGFFLAGGKSPDLPILIAMSIVGLWQLPHFWLILLSHQKDYHHSGYKSMLNLLSERQIRRIILSWVVAFAFLSLFLPFLGIITSPIATSALLLNTLFLTGYFSYRCLQKNHLAPKSSSQLLLHLNFSLLLIMVLGIVAN